MIAEIYIDDQSAMCWPVMQGKVISEVTVTLPLSHLSEKKITVPRAAKTTSKRLLREAFTQTKNNLQIASYRKSFRLKQIASVVRKEINVALWSSTRKRTFHLGLMSPDIDTELFGIDIPDPTTSEYSHKLENLGHLDGILGQGWDISQKDGVSRYVTSIKFRVTCDLSLSGSIRVADFDSLLPLTNYRQMLRQHMLSC